MIIEQLVNGITIGIVYALIAVGYSLVFGILRLVNFSHGSVYAFGAHMTMVFIGMKFGIVPALIASIIITGILGIAIDKFGLEPLRRKQSGGISALITTIGISYIIQNMLMIIYGSQTKPFPKLFDYGYVNIGSLRIHSTQIAIFTVSLILLIAFTYIIRKTKIGLAMRAIEQSQKAAHLMGVNVDRIVNFTFFLGGASAAIAGTLISGLYQVVYPTMGFLPGLKAFSAAVLGGIGVLHGSIVGGLVVGISESFAAYLFGGTYRDALAFVILIIVLITKPNGLFGKKDITKI